MSSSVTSGWLVQGAGAVLVTLVLGLAALAPLVSPNDPSEQHRDHVLAPPMRPHVVDAEGRIVRPFVYPLRSIDRLERRFAEDRTRPLPLRWFADGRLLSVDGASGDLWFPLGADHLGRDVWSRLAHGARLSLLVSAAAVSGAILLGALIGAWSGYAGGWLDATLMRLAELVLVLPVLYVVLAARSVLPLVLDAPAVFLLLTSVLAAVGWPFVARGVRAIVADEARRDYAQAARAAGAGSVRLVGRHLLPATAGFLRSQALMLVPIAVMAETTLSFVGLGFGADRPSWGTLLRDASDIRVLAEAPWLLSAAAVIVILVFGLNLLTAPRSDARGASWT